MEPLRTDDTLAELVICDCVAIACFTCSHKLSSSTPGYRRGTRQMIKILSDIYELS